MIQKLGNIVKYFDQHIHNEYSYDSNETPENYIKAARERGFNAITFTNHIDYEHTMTNCDWKFDPLVEKKHIQKLRKDNPDIFIGEGIELGYYPKRMNDTAKIAKLIDYDVINFSLHYVENIDFYWPEEFITNGIENTINIYFDKEIEMLDAFSNFDVVCHIDYGFKTYKRFTENTKISDFEDKLKIIMKKIIQMDKTLEINTKVQETINDDEHIKYLLKLYKSLGGTNLTLSSDAHKVERLASSFEHFIPIIKEMGFDHLCYFVKRKRYNFYI